MKFMATSTREIERQSIEEAEGVGKPGTIASVAIHNAVLAGGETTRTIADILHGTWLGHPLHPILTDITIGAWTLGSAFDVVAALTQSDAARDTADQLTAIGTASAIPTAITGIIDYSTFPDHSANTATWHGVLNLVNFGLYAMSVRERRRGNRARAIAYSATGMVLTGISSWLGGHLVYKSRVGVDNSDQFEKPTTWKPVAELTHLQNEKPRVVKVDDKDVMLYRRGDEVFALGNKCAHAGGPLNEGHFKGSCVECPWHNSVFDMHEGKIVHGPSTHPQPYFETRVRDGQVEIRLPEDAR
jgi:nitrite reductase/ring-hydroxylating ferredoxin subunit/uncharacterized membrane protein